MSEQFPFSNMFRCVYPLIMRQRLERFPLLAPVVLLGTSAYKFLFKRVFSFPVLCLGHAGQFSTVAASFHVPASRMCVWLQLLHPVTSSAICLSPSRRPPVGVEGHFTMALIGTDAMTILPYVSHYFYVFFGENVFSYPQSTL